MLSEFFYDSFIRLKNLNKILLLITVTTIKIVLNKIAYMYSDIEIFIDM